MKFPRFNLTRSIFSNIYSLSIQTTYSTHLLNPFTPRSIHTPLSPHPMPPKPPNPPKKPPPSDLPTHTFPTPRDLETFLETNHTTSPGFYLKLAKKSSRIPSITAPQAVETALCFGWIDGRANTLDENYWLVRYTPRRAKSIWSQKNVDTVTRLVSAGRMRPAGLAAVDAAKKDGRWERAYAGPASMGVAEDFRVVLERDEKAKGFFEGLKRSERYAVLWRVETASVKARKGRIEGLVRMLAEGKIPGEKASSEGEVASVKRKIEPVDDGESGSRRKSTRIAAKTK
jgi:uncharacterized protein YdeI (YjbR/CyaY-like superfamily)